MKNKRENKFSLAGQRLYPHFKLTAQRFPRLLATRRIERDGAEYFGAFLPETGVRFLIDFLNKTFRLRACEIDIDGSFDVPCTQFYRQRCVAPCVENLCDESEYAERVELVRLFLRHEAGALEKVYRQKIEAAAEGFEFERAARLRDEWQTIEKILGAKERNFWLADAVDTFEIAETAGEFLVYLVTMRGRKTLGKRTFVFERAGAKEEILPAILPEFYRFHAPREIRVSADFAGRPALAEELSRKFNRRIKITLARAGGPKILTRRALGRTKYEHELRQIRRVKSFAEISSELKEMFGLPENPKRIEGFDAAHISGSDFTAAKSVWENGKFLGEEYSFWFSAEAAELETLRKFIELRFAAPDKKDFPDLILIDGGRAHLQAALKGLENLGNRKPAVISAVKPPQRHDEIAHFLTETGARIEFDAANETHRVLQTLRDEAHNLSNEIHRQRREMAHFYELAAVLPSLKESDRRALLKTAGSIKNILELNESDLKTYPGEKARAILRDLQNYRNGISAKIEPVIVPLRYTDENGDAQDLRPLASYRAK